MEGTQLVKPDDLNDAVDLVLSNKVKSVELMFSEDIRDLGLLGDINRRHLLVAVKKIKLPNEVIGTITLNGNIRIQRRINNTIFKSSFTDLNRGK
jgi:hypothetical protein